MKNKIIIIYILMFISNYGKGQSWQWSKHLGSSYQFFGERANNVFCDGNDIYLVGSYGGTLYFPADSLSSNGFNDIFIAKFNQNGDLIWFRSIGSTSMSPGELEDGRGALDTVNHWFYVSGSIYGIVDFGNGVILNTGTTGNVDSFIAKYDSSGQCQWAKLIGSPGYDYAHCFVQPDSKVLVAGKLADNGYVDTLAVNAGGFFARFDSGGNLLWAEHKFSGPEEYKIDISFIGNDIIMTGSFNNNTCFIDTSNLILTGTTNGFLTRLDSTGHVKWINTFNGPGVNTGYGTRTDQLSNIYVTGTFQDSTQLGSMKLYDTDQDFYLAKFDGNGGVIWGAQANCDGSIAAGLSIVIDNDGNPVVIGTFNGNAHFGSFSINTTNQYDMFITKYDNNGACVGIRNFGTASGFALAINENNDEICSGVFWNTVNIGGTSLTALFAQDIFLAKCDEIVGIEEERQSIDQLKIYSNPNNGTCILEIPDDFINDKNALISIYDSNGKMVKQQTLNLYNSKYQLNIEMKAKGIYNVILSNRFKNYYGRIVFE